MLSLQVANEIQDMHEELVYLRAENKRLAALADEYAQYVRDDIKAGETQMAGWLSLFMDKRISFDSVPNWGGVK